jgi:hypothetical protein
VKTKAERERAMQGKKGDKIKKEKNTEKIEEVVTEDDSFWGRF